MPLKRRTAKIGIASLAIVGMAAVSVASYRPRDATSHALAAASLKRALAALDDTELDSTARITAYKEGLLETDRLLCLALRANPTDTLAIERLATVRWESGVLAGEPDLRAVTALMDVAAARAPQVPEIQADLGNLLCKMGRTTEAGAYLRRALELSPSMTNRAVSTLASSGVSAETVLELLPPTQDVLIATKDMFIASGTGLVFLDRVEPRLPAAGPMLLSSYGEACLQLGEAARLRDRMLALPRSEDQAVRAERSRQTAHAWLSLGDPERAIPPALEASRIAASDPGMIEFYGEVALVAGRGADAEAAFRRSLELVLQDGASPASRARLYDALGRSLESQGRRDVAYEAFRRAVDLDPGATGAAARLASYELRTTSPPR